MHNDLNCNTVRLSERIKAQMSSHKSFTYINNERSGRHPFLEERYKKY